MKYEVELGVTELERRRKEDLLDIVKYEIEMLNYSFAWLQKHGKDADPETAVYLESFLIHYRNFVHFFDTGASRNELSIRKSAQWKETPIDSKALKAIEKKAAGLYEKYSKDISKYMAHCSPDRSKIPYRWKIGEMYQSLEAVVAEFAKVTGTQPKASTSPVEMSLGTPTVRKFNLLPETEAVPVVYKPRK